MKFSLKTLALGFGILAVLYGALSGIEHKVAAMQAEASKNTRLGPRACGVDESETRRQRLKRARKLSSVEAVELLQKTIIPKYSVEDVTLAEALEMLNDKLAEQMGEDQPRPRILVDPDYQKKVKDFGLYDVSLEAALGGSIDSLGSHEIKIAELRVTNIPAIILLKYICDMTRMTYFTYRGNVYLSGFSGVNSSYEFFTSEVLGQIKLSEIGAHQLIGEIGAIINQHEYFGHKAGLSLHMSDNARKALLSGQIALPRINLNVDDATLSELVLEIVENSKGLIVQDPNYRGVLYYDPLKEIQRVSQDLANPFGSGDDIANGDIFNVELNENWRTWEPEEDPFSPDPKLEETLGQ